MCKKIFMRVLLVLILLFVPLIVSVEAQLENSSQKNHPIENLVGEKLYYDVSFLWFKRLAEGSISLQRAEQPGTYLAVMQARTLGMAAFFTRNRIEKYQTLLEIGPTGLLRPLVHSSHTFKGSGDQQREKRTTYRFDFSARQVHYKKVKNGRVDADELLSLETDGPVFDILSAFYNLRIESFGKIAHRKIVLPTFHRKGVEEIVVAPVEKLSSSEQKFFADTTLLFKVLVDPSVFKTKGRDLYVGFDEKNRLEKGIIKNVIGLGDVKGVLRHDLSFFPPED
ncbi:MAG: DUF3108 domain-containing protein [Desulfuromonadales bacterium]|nr:DUF3108 domain-containing protein [Desulfuromonadales bacterium]